MWYVTNQKHGVSALGLQRILGLGSYQTAWAWLHKLRRAMVRPGRDLLGGAVEVDETYVGGRETGVVGRQTKTKSIVAIAAEVRGRGTGRIRMSRVEDVAARSLIPFVQTTVAPGATVRTDGWSAYSGLANQGYDHQPRSISASGDPAHIVMPRVHRVAALLDRWWLGIHHGAIDADHLDYYLDEFTFRFNRRRSQARGLLFFRLLQQAVQHEPVPYKGLVGGQPRKPNVGDTRAKWTPSKPETAKRVRQRIGTIMKWAIAQGHRTDNPAGEALGAALPKTDNGKRHHAALPHAKVADAIEVVQGSGAGMAVKLAFEFLVLTAARSGEIRLATWGEIDTDARTWTVPAERMKANQEHRVPLCARAMQILTEARALEAASGLVFPGTRAGKPLADLTLSKLMRDLNIDAVPHGFRSSFRDWAAERANAPPAVAEAALAHTVRNKVEAAYNRTDLFDRRRRLMDQWAGYLEDGTGCVVSMVRAHE